MDLYRLPKTVVPSRYELRLEPDLGTSTFRGETVIHVDVREPVAEVLLNAIELDVEKAEFVDATGRRVTAIIQLDAKTERCRLTVKETLALGPWQLHLSFKGTLNDQLRGFYRSSYTLPDGKKRYLAATQFEATDARRAFPCWDEPAFKAVFSCTLAIDPSLTAISNSRPLSETIQDGRKVIRFADTMAMSTYLVAFIVGELQGTEPTFIGKVPLRVWSVPGKRNLTGFGQEIGTASLRFFGDYYRRPYPGDKLDLVAIPDFAAGAMENFGAITFRETALLVDQDTATHAELERVADVVAHENAHMWFGDLVTMSWWNGLWLNEAFATFMEMLAVDAFRPDWQRWTTFGVSRASALQVDALAASRPIEFAVSAPKDAEAMFDVLTYEKGASVLRMLEQYVGSEVFRRGVKRYLDRHAFGNTETRDLWVALGEAAEAPIPDLMNGWIFQQGYPLMQSECRDGKLLIRQQPFRYLDGAAANDRWQVPIQVRIAAGNKTDTRRLLLDQEQVSVPLPTNYDYVVVNEGGHGFYRVQYPPELLRALLDNLNDLSAIERFNLVNDSWALALAGRLDVTAYCELTEPFKGERDKNVWSVIVNSFSALNRVIEERQRPWLEGVVRDRVAPACAELGWDPRPGDSELTRQLRGDLLRALGTLGNDSAVQRRAEEVYDRFTEKPEAVDASVASAAIAVVAHAGNEHRYGDFLERFRSARTPQDQQRYLYALGAFRPPSLISQTLPRTINGEIRSQDAGLFLRTLLMSVHSRGLTWAFIKDNWQTLGKVLPPPGLRRMYEGVVGLATRQWEQDVTDFFQRTKIDLGGRILAQYLEQLHIAVMMGTRTAPLG
jgi:puromycin-sensitive aminopeptidase